MRAKKSSIQLSRGPKLNPKLMKKLKEEKRKSLRASSTNLIEKLLLPYSKNKWIR